MQFGSANLLLGEENDKCSFQGSEGNHYPLQQCHGDITMTTTKRLPSSMAKTIEILIKAILFFFFLTNGRKTSTKCYPEIHDQEHFQNSNILLASFQTHMICPHLPKAQPPALKNSNFIDLINLHLSRSFVKYYKIR